MLRSRLGAFQPGRPSLSAIPAITREIERQPIQERSAHLLTTYFPSARAPRRVRPRDRRNRPCVRRNESDDGAQPAHPKGPVRDEMKSKSPRWEGCSDTSHLHTDEFGDRLEGVPGYEHDLGCRCGTSGVEICTPGRAEKRRSQSIRLI